MSEEEVSEDTYYGHKVIDTSILGMMVFAVPEAEIKGSIKSRFTVKCPYCQNPQAHSFTGYKDTTLQWACKCRLCEYRIIPTDESAWKAWLEENGK